MPHVLAPGLEFLRTPTELLAKAGQRRTKAVGVRIGNASPLKGFPENRANRPSTPPMRPSYTGRLKLMAPAKGDPSGREKRIIRSPQFLGVEIIDPFLHDRADIVADGKEKGRKRLAELGIHLPSVLIELPFSHVDVLQLQ